MGYRLDLNKIDKLRIKRDKIDEEIKKKEENLIDQFYKDNPPKKIEALKNVIEKEGAEWQKIEYIDFHKLYHNKKLTCSHIRYFDKIHNEYGEYIKYKDSFLDKMEKLWEGAK